MTIDTHDLAKWIRSFDVAQVSTEALHKAALLILDSVGVAIAAVNEENTCGVLRVVADEGGLPQCQVIGTNLRLPLTRAVLANGALIRALDYNDFMGAGNLGGHPSDNIAVALSVGEFCNSQGREVLAAVVMGYELYGRLQELIDRDKPWDHTSASGIVAPAMAGRLMALPEAQLAHALAISAAHCAALSAIRTGHISSLKMLANAIIAETGMLATRLAAQGLTGPVHVLDGRRGMTSAVLGAAIDKLIDPCGPQFRILDVAVKPYPCIGTGQSAIAAALALRKFWPTGLPDLEQIIVTMSDKPAVRAQVDDGDRRHPNCREAADHSFYFLIAAALMDGELGQAQFVNQRWTHPNICSLMERIEIRVDPALTDTAPGSFPCAIGVLTKGGEEKSVQVTYPPGHPRSDLSDDMVIEKFERCTRERLNQRQRSDIVRAALALEEDGSVSDLMGLLEVSADGSVAKDSTHREL